MAIPQLKKYFNAIPDDFQPLIAHPYCFQRMQSIIKWNEIHCDYWHGIEDQISIHERAIKSYKKNGIVCEFEAMELQMLLIYRRDLAIRNILK